MYSFNETDGQLDTLNKLILSVVDKHEPLVKTKFARPPAPWMKDLKMNKLQCDWDIGDMKGTKIQQTKTGTHRESKNKIKNQF